MNVKLKMKPMAGWQEELFDKDLTVRNGRAKIDLPEIPFNAKELKLEVRISLILCYRVKNRF